MTGGYYQYGSDGNVLWTAPPEDAQGKFGKWKVQEEGGTWKWEWLAAAIATPPAPPPTSTYEPTSVPSATPAELLGGDKTSVVFAISYGSGFVYDIPKEVQPALTPTTPEQWANLQMPTRADGTEIPWGKLVTIQISDSLYETVIPVLIKTVVEIPNTGNLGGTHILPVYEIPANGGSNFIIPALQKNGYSTSPITNIRTLKEGIPADWKTGKSLDLPTFLGLVNPKMVNGADYGAELRKHIGEVVLISFPKGLDSEWYSVLAIISTNELASGGGNINHYAEPGSLILP